jgi:uncharacterized LabA/DUF88 family protein
MSEYVYVDNSNVYIEGRRVSAVKKGLARDINQAMAYNIQDPDYRVDFGKLHDFVAGNDPKKICRAMLFGSRPPPNDSLWKMAQKAGFETVVVDRNVRNQEKKVDTGIVAAMVKDAYTRVKKAEDTISLVAGDGDFVPAVLDLKSDGFRIEVVFWGHASKELRDSCSKFYNLNSYLEILKK